MSQTKSWNATRSQVGSGVEAVGVRALRGSPDAGRSREKPHPRSPIWILRTLPRVALRNRRPTEDLVSDPHRLNGEDRSPKDWDQDLNRG